MAATIKIKNSSTAGAAPTSSDLVQGELAVNVTDKRLFTENSGGTVVELGTNPSSITLPDGSASAPTLLHSGDTNTGLFFPAADTIALTTGGTERLRLDSSGNLGVGVTPSAWNSIFKALQINAQGALMATSASMQMGNNVFYDGAYKFIGTGYANRYYQASGQHVWTVSTASGSAGGTITETQAMTLDASGNLGIATNSPSTFGKVAIRGGITVNAGATSLTGTSFSASDAANSTFWISHSSGNVNLVSDSVLAFWAATSGGGVAERARIDSSGNLLVGTTSQPSPASVTSKAFIASSASNDGSWTGTFQGTGATSNRGVVVFYPNASPNDANNQAFYFRDSTATRFEMRSNGGIANYSANNVNLSDVRTKTDIQDAGSYLSKICAIPVRTFKYKDQTDDLLNLGVIAQEVEAVAPELVDVSGFGETPEDGVPLKAIYQTDLQYALMKALQELNAKFEAYKAAHP